MKKLILFIFLMTFVAACRDTTGPNKGPGPKMVPDHTPYIASLIEASPDTTFHYPEVLVGYFTDARIGYYPPSLEKLHELGILPKHQYKGLYSIPIKEQVVNTSIIFGLSWQPESQATVKIRGPLDTPQEKEVSLTSEGNGVYGDEGYTLPLVADGRYRLQVKLPDGRQYVSQTYIPDSVHIVLKDSISMPVFYTPYNNGAPSEKGKGYKINYTPAQNGYRSIWQWNSDRDRQLLQLKPDETFLYAGYGNYLREGNAYAISLTGRTESFKIPYGQELSFRKTLDDVWMSQHWWLRYSTLSTGVGKMFITPFVWTVMSVKYSNTIDDAPLDSAAAKDTHYLHNISTIAKVGKDGKTLPLDSTDAIGFFGGEYSRYLQTTVYPDRQFNLDSVMMAWYNKNK